MGKGTAAAAGPAVKKARTGGKSRAPGVRLNPWGAGQAAEEERRKKEQLSAAISWMIEKEAEIKAKDPHARGSWGEKAAVKATGADGELLFPDIKGWDELLPPTGPDEGLEEDY